MLHPQLFDHAYLGVVEEFEADICSGFGGTVRQGRWAIFWLLYFNFTEATRRR